MTEEILQIDKKFSLDKSIKKYEVKEYTPISGTTNLNTSVEIRISIQQQDQWLHLSESYLLIEGKVTKNDGSLFANTDNIAFCNNGLMHMFEHIKYELSGQEIEYLNHLGRATTMLGLLKYSEDFSKTQGLNMMFFKDDGSGTADTNKNNGFAKRHQALIEEPNPKGTFSFIIPLKHIFGFAEDYDKVMWGFTHQLTLKRKNDDDALFKNTETAEGKITLDKLSWFIPHVSPALDQENKLTTIIDNKSPLDVGFQARACYATTVTETTHFTWRLSSNSEKPRWIIVGFQTNKKSDQDKNSSIFNHLDLRNIYITLNGARYPEVDYGLSFPKQQFSRVYHDAAAFKSKFYGIDEHALISPSSYKNLYPLFVFDVSKQSERIKNSITDIELQAFFNTNVPANTEVYAVVISDKMLVFTSDGNKMAIVVNN